MKRICLYPTPWDNLISPKSCEQEKTWFFQNPVKWGLYWIFSREVKLLTAKPKCQITSGIKNFIWGRNLRINKNQKEDPYLIFFLKMSNCSPTTRKWIRANLVDNWEQNLRIVELFVENWEQSLWILKKFSRRMVDFFSTSSRPRLTDFIKIFYKNLLALKRELFFNIFSTLSDQVFFSVFLRRMLNFEKYFFKHSMESYKNIFF